MTMTPERRAGIQARHQALVDHTTAGDWRYDETDAVHVFPADGGDAELVATVWGEDGSDDEEKALGEWIAHSRRDVPDLLAQVADYENRITWHTTCQGCAGHLDREYAVDRRAADAEAEAERLRAELASSRVEAAKWAAVEPIIQRVADHGGGRIDVDDLLEAAQSGAEPEPHPLTGRDGNEPITAEHMMAVAASTPITAEHMTALAASTLDNPALVRRLDGHLEVIAYPAYRPILWQSDLDAVELQGRSPERQAVEVTQLEALLIAREADRG